VPGERLTRLALLTCVVATGCSSTTPEGDCIASPSSPIDVSIAGAPADAGVGSFAVIATGSSGDTPALQASAANGGVTFSGTGLTSETYVVTVTYDHSVVYQANAPWSVAGCGFVVSLQFGDWDGGAEQ
jgi:hypothetical protein